MKNTSSYEYERFKRVGAPMPWDLKKGCVGLIETYHSFFPTLRVGNITYKKKGEVWVLWRLLSVLTYWGKREKGEPAHESSQCIWKWTAVGSGRPARFSWSSLRSHFANPKVISLVFWQILGCRNCSLGFGGKFVNAAAQRTNLWLAGWKRWKAVEKTCLMQILFLSV